MPHYWSIVFLLCFREQSTFAGTLESRSSSSRFVLDNSKVPSHRVINEMLVPKSSTTALICDPIFGADGTATWYKDGQIVAHVTSGENAILDGRNYVSNEPMPDVGFLVITDIVLGDEGDYWCARDSDNQTGDVVRLIVAYMDALRANTRPQFVPSKAIIGQPLRGDCPFPNAVPQPAVTWILNDEPVSYSENIEMLRNGSILIRRFSISNSGLYECVISNFAGRTSAKIYVDVPSDSERNIGDLFDTSIFGYTCSSYALLRNAVAWFLIGCLLISCLVLCYLLFVTLFLRSRHRLRLIRPVSHGQIPALLRDSTN